MNRDSFVIKGLTYFGVYTFLPINNKNCWIFLLNLKHILKLLNLNKIFDSIKII